MMLKTVQKKKLSEEIVDQIESLIEQGELKSGNRLPSIEKLAKIFNVSQNSLREALVVLERLKLIEVKQGKGIFIR